MIPRAVALRNYGDSLLTVCTECTEGNRLTVPLRAGGGVRPRAVDEERAGATVILDRSHAFSDGLNLTGITDNLTSARSESYLYTATNRLQESGGIWGALTWTYDFVGNRTSEVLTSGSATTRTYDYPGASNKLSTVTEGASVRTFTHDGSGNVTADDRAGTTLSLSP